VDNSIPSQRRPFAIAFLLTMAMALFAAASSRVWCQGAAGGSSAAEPVTSEVQETLPSLEATSESPALEAPVNAETFRVGPNDVLQLSLPPLPVPYTIVIGPDNRLVLPRDLPAFDVTGMTLKEVRDKVEGLYRTRAAAARNVALTLRSARRVRIRVVGDVLVPGPLVLTAADRVSTAIDLANISSDRLSPDEQKYRVALEGERRRRGEVEGTQTTRLRNVVVRHNDGTSDIVDLVRWRYLGDDRANPTLREGDEIEVPADDETTGQIGVTGSLGVRVNVPYRSGDNALLLARAAAVPATPGTKLHLKRAAGSGIQTIELDAQDVEALERTTLQAGDVLVLHGSTGDGVTGVRPGLVQIVGRVARPGSYPIVPGVTRLSEVFAEAGGPTDDASLNGTYIVRKTERSDDGLSTPSTDPASLLSTSTLSMEDTTRISRDLMAQGGRVSVDVDGLLRRGDASRDILLRDADKIVVPENPRHVEVIGRVNHPGAVDFVAGAALQYYIDRAGGYTHAAEPSRVQLLRFGSGVWASPSESPILAGDIVYIPGERDSPARTPLEVTQTVISIIGGVAAIALTIVYIVQALQR